MPTWSGWVNEFLNAANIIITPPNRTFMSEWAKHAPGTCKNNPIDLTKAVTGSTRCGATIGGFGRSQNYPSHASAAHAFDLSIHTDWVKPLRDALDTGNPFQIGDRTKVVDVLNRWASPSFARWYANATTSGTTGGGHSGGGKAARAHHGWADLRRTTNHNLPRALRRSRHNTAAALRALSKGRKVRH
jgi:hypothetical protein